ncbi:outer membrane protein A [Leminorella grimontii ATCC 33999 = DSM 5078]|nr:outer membrane protein A [Leminorella grimontii ATCC 33999 = DSM 5078]
MISLGNALFKFSGKSAADMEVGGQDVIGKMATYLKGQPHLTRVNIVGHADPVGNPASNRKLSLQRAEVIKQLLVAEGVSEGVLFPNGQGSSDPVIECKGKMSVTERNACNRTNRRVDVLIHAYNPAD